jgi:hypothetical protein
MTSVIKQQVAVDLWQYDLCNSAGVLTGGGCCAAPDATSAMGSAILCAGTATVRNVRPCTTGCGTPRTQLNP